ncbi:hypothetical protein COD78_31250 [Bacillus cereus]|uniref:hypothetical protein n=1 Tax=Bacillus cereus TaxID=1396 RepID=UPI000BFDC086|nr:hypothetical protein [Bacillus cereus]PGV17218.1 hypothetical protein COD78_31250 [Bacillus cereus]
MGQFREGIMIGDWVVCEMEDMSMVTQVKKIFEGTVKGKFDLWGHWYSRDSIKGEWGYNHADRCRYATVKEINEINRKSAFIIKGRQPEEYRHGDLVKYNGATLIVLDQMQDRIRANIVNLHQILELDTKEIEPLFFCEDIIKG